MSLTFASFFDSYLTGSASTEGSSCSLLPLLEQRHPFALGHMINHPAEGQEPNVLEVAYNFAPAANKEGGQDISWLRAYLPTVPFIPPEAFEAYMVKDEEEAEGWWGKKKAPRAEESSLAPELEQLLLRASALLPPQGAASPSQGLALVATRTIQDGEELLQNYRLNPYQEQPDWYHSVNPEQAYRRWAKLPLASAPVRRAVRCEAAAMKGVRLVGVGSAIPEGFLTNDDLSKYVDTNDEWIASRTGIRKRHILGKDESIAMLAEKACASALEMAGIAAADIDMIIFATSSPDDVFGDACTGDKPNSETGASSEGSYANVKMSGTEVFKFAVKKVPAKANVSHAPTHSTTLRLLLPSPAAAARQPVQTLTDTVGLPATLAMAGFGAGLTWAGAIVKWG
eukprot:gene21314-28245_t